MEVEKAGVNVIDAAARGAGDGLQLSLNTGGMIIALLAIVALINGGLGRVHSQVSWIPGSLRQILALLFAPIRYKAS